MSYANWWTKPLAGLMALMLGATAIVATSAPKADAATVFRGWVFTADVSAIRTDGLALENVSYQGLKIFDRISLPVMNVFYDNDACGPYVDRIGGTIYTSEGPTEFTQDGVRWMQIGLTDQLGAYTITQMFYLSENGDFDAHIFSKGLQCNTRHDHVPFWRIDFAVAGGANDQIRRATDNGMVTMTNEFSMSATAAVNHGWEVRDSVTGDFVTIDFDDGNFGLGGDTVIPEIDYVENNVYGRQYQSSEQSWRTGATYDLFGDNGETINNAVLWYSGWLPHRPEEGAFLWHSTGIRMRVNPQDGGLDSSIGGRASNTSGGAVPGVAVDLFTENRAAYLSSTSTSSSGDFTFDVDPGCYVLTYIAPDGSTFGGGSQFLNAPVCVDQGQQSTANNVTVVSPGAGVASVGDRVTYSNGSPAPGVNIDLFSAGRSRYMGSTTTGADGRYSFDLGSAMCGVVTFVAPAGESFVGSGGPYQNSDFCVAAGQSLTTVDAVLLAASSQATLGGQISNAGGGAGVPGVKVVLYQAAGDGSRGAWLEDTNSNGSGNYTFSVGSGCYVIDLVAPSGRSWQATGGQYQQISACVAPGGSTTSLSGVLN